MRSYICCKTKSSWGGLQLWFTGAVFSRIPSQYSMQESVSKTRQVLRPVEVVNDLDPCCVPNPIQPACYQSILLAHQILKEENFHYEVLQRFSGNNNLRDSGNCRREHDFAPRHRLHHH